MNETERRPKFVLFPELVCFANSYMDEPAPEKKSDLAFNLERRLCRERDSIGIEAVLRIGKIKREIESLRSQLAAKTEECLALAVAGEKKDDALDNIENLAHEEVFFGCIIDEVQEALSLPSNAKQIVEEFRKGCWEDAEKFILDLWQASKATVRPFGVSSNEIVWALRTVRKMRKAAARKEGE